MADFEETTHEYWLITRCKATDKVTIEAASYDDIGRRHTPYGEVEPADLPIPECKIGARVMENVIDDTEVDFDGEFGITRDVKLDCDCILVPLKPITPEPLTGLAWLKSLPVGTRICSPLGGGRIQMVRYGICWVDASQIELFSKIDKGWAKRCCAENCPEWRPEGDTE